MREDESGVVVVLVAIMLVAILGMAALAIDVGSFYRAQRQAQTAADAAALAASQDLPTGTAAAQTDGTTYATTNDPGATVTVQTPYAGSATKVKVTINTTAPSYLGQLFGVTKAYISATAVAGGTGSTTPSAVFAKDTNCNNQGVTADGSGYTIIGGTHGNGSVFINGSSLNMGTLTYGGPNGCSLTSHGSGNTFGGGTPTADPNNEPWPIDYSTMSFPSPPACTYTAASFSYTGSNITLPAGVYCATQNDISLTGSNIDASACTFVAQQGNITIGGSGITVGGDMFANGPNGTIQLNGTGISVNSVMESTGANGQININGSTITGHATMVATAMQLNGSGIQLAPYPGYKNLTAYETGTQDLHISGSGYLTGGSIFAPNAAITLTGSGTGVGLIEGLDVTLHGSGYQITGNGPPAGGSTSSSLLQ